MMTTPHQRADVEGTGLLSEVVGGTGGVLGGKNTSLVKVLTMEGTCFLPVYSIVEARDSNSKATS